jgi:hypothetical protein
MLCPPILGVVLFDFSILFTSFVVWINPIKLKQLKKFRKENNRNKK